MGMSIATRLKDQLAVESANQVMAFAQQRGLHPLVFVEWQEQRKRIGQQAGWHVIGLEPPLWGPQQGNVTRFFPSATTREARDLVRQDAFDYGTRRYGVRDWARVQGMAGAYFPTGIVTALKGALKALEPKPENTTRGRKPSRGDLPLREHMIEAMQALQAQGMTWSEVSTLFDVHHGVSSGHLSVMHEDGTLARLSDRRGGQKIYVLPEYVNGRETEAYGIDKRNLTSGEQAAIAAIRLDLTKGIRSDPVNVRLLLEALERVLS